jgi:sugar transferase EpsL
MKRIFDLVISTSMLLLTLPIMVLIALFIRLIVGSPIFYKQSRPGLNSKIFNMIKFRTMSKLIYLVFL